MVGNRKLTRKEVYKIVKLARRRGKRPDLNEANLKGVDLSSAELGDADLKKADLSDANLSEADLNRADLSEAKLWRANLTWANLRKANLKGATLWDANLSKADLTGSDLRETMLVSANLNGADLSGADLKEATLERTDLSGATLNSADLREAKLLRANLNGADLSRANLSYAELAKTDLRHSKFINAVLAFATLDGATFITADFCGLDLTGALVKNTLFADVDLSEVRGLDTVVHLGPSDISLGTLHKSRGKIAKSFLRGAGVTETFIHHICSFANDSIQYYSCFISYSHQDELFAQRLHADLQQNNVRCWYAPDHLKNGANPHLNSNRAIQQPNKLLLILSKHSIQCDWVEGEVRAMLKHEKAYKEVALYPIRLDDTVLNNNLDTWADQLQQSHSIGDFTQWKDHQAYQQAFKQLLLDLRVKA